MATEPQYLNDCYAILRQDGISLEARVFAAGKLFWKTVINGERWSKTLQDRAAQLIHKLVDLGVIGTNDREFDAVEASEVCTELMKFIEEHRGIENPVQIVTRVTEATKFQAAANN